MLVMRLSGRLAGAGHFVLLEITIQSGSPYLARHCKQSASMLNEQFRGKYHQNHEAGLEKMSIKLGRKKVLRQRRY